MFYFLFFFWSLQFWCKIYFCVTFCIPSFLFWYQYINNICVSCLIGCPLFDWWDWSISTILVETNLKLSGTSWVFMNEVNHVWCVFFSISVFVVILYSSYYSMKVKSSNMAFMFNCIGQNLFILTITQSEIDPCTFWVIYWMNYAIELMLFICIDQ